LNTERSLVLSGPPGSGKSTLGPRLAAALSKPFVDLDALFERTVDTSIRSYFSQHGEAQFRLVERELLLRTLSESNAVVALGGGTLLDATLRHEVLRRCTVVGLEASLETLVDRMGEGTTRPLLMGDTERALSTLLEVRRAGYAEAHVRCDTGELAHDDVVARALAVHARRPCVVPLGDRSYCVELGAVENARDVIGTMLRAPGHGTMISDRRVQRLWHPERLLSLGLKRFEVPQGEPAKNIHWTARIWQACLDSGADRSWLIACIGGGTISDAGGFAASTLLRGVRYVTVPTTLLAMVDASVGGKTAVNLPTGKNLAGTFFHPSLVWIDPTFAQTLTP
jgi:shikimate kinase / 3-dehydroquinate synthase